MKKYSTINDVDSEGVVELLQCLCEAITGLDWRMEAEPETIDESDYEKIEEWKKTLSKFPKEYWADCMLNENYEEEND
jgi:hypothetical protein